MEHGEDERDRDRDTKSGQGAMEQARDKEWALREHDPRRPSRQARRNTRDTLSLEEARKRDHGMGPYQ